jgi:hypothetical protein
MNQEMQTQISQNTTFQNIMNQAKYERERQKMQYPFIYSISGSLVGQASYVHTLNIEAGSDFRVMCATGRFYSYSAQNASTFPMPLSTNPAYWAARGLVVQVTDGGSGNDLTAGFLPVELLFSPGYGLNFMAPLNWRPYFKRNSTVRFTFQNRDAATRTHSYDIALIGDKILVPDGSN